MNYKFTLEQLGIIIDLASDGLGDYTLLCLQDEDGSPAFNFYQMDVLSKAIRDGVLCEDMYNPSLNDMDMNDMYESLLEKKMLEHKPVLRGQLKK